MSDDYTPTTKEVRASYCDSEARHENHGGSWIAEEQHAKYHAEFDRWLAAHDRGIAARTLVSAALDVVNGGHVSHDTLPIRPERHQIAAWLRERAAELEEAR